MTFVDKEQDQHFKENTLMIDSKKCEKINERIIINYLDKLKIRL